jgi:hypothetical protein
MGLMAVDTVKVENGKFEITGKATEPVFHTLQVEGVEGKVPFILENGDIAIVIDKDSINKSKVSGTYNNDEFVKFTEELTKIQKRLMDFQKNNTLAMTQAQQAKDSITINRLMKEYGDIQQVVNTEAKKKYNTYAETHPKSFITVLIIRGMIGDPSVDIKSVEKLFSGLDDSLKTTKPGKEIAEKIKATKTPSVGATAVPQAPAAGK